jgi:hypothetical protein
MCFHKFDIGGAALIDGELFNVCQPCARTEWHAMVFKWMATR